MTRLLREDLSRNLGFYITLVLLLAQLLKFSPSSLVLSSS